MALVFYEKLLPGTQLVNKLQDLNYRVQTVSDTDSLIRHAAESRPLLVIVDLLSRKADIPLAIKAIRGNPTTSHLPVLAYCDEKEASLADSARKAGANLVVNSSIITPHLAQFLDQALQLE